MAEGSRRIPLWIKLAYTAFMAIWVPVYWTHRGPANFLWLCDVGNFLLFAALWTESRLLLSWQACGLLLIQAGFVVDLAGRLVLGVHPIGGTAHLFATATPLGVRLLSLFHVALLPLLLFGVWRLGYDRRALWLQIATAWIVLPIGYFAFEDRNLNFVRAPFDEPQALVPAGVYFAACMVAYPLLLYLPSHLLLRWWRGHPRPAPDSRSSRIR